MPLCMHKYITIVKVSLANPTHRCITPNDYIIRAFRVAHYKIHISIVILHSSCIILLSDRFTIYSTINCTTVYCRSRNMFFRFAMIKRRVASRLFCVSSVCKHSPEVEICIYIILIDSLIYTSIYIYILSVRRHAVIAIDRQTK
jgi:hypothetical protein